jgi:hypothetical protein
MNRSSRNQATPSNLSESTQRLLNSYAMAASAAGVSVLALAMPAEAKIVYTHAHHVITRGGTYKLDVNHDGTTDFTLNDTYKSTTSGFYAILSAAPAAGNGLEGWTGAQAWDGWPSLSRTKAGAFGRRQICPRHSHPSSACVLDSL